MRLNTPFIGQGSKIGYKTDDSYHMTVQETDDPDYAEHMHCACWTHADVTMTCTKTEKIPNNFLINSRFRVNRKDYTL